MHHDSLEKNDPVWDCTLIKVMKEKGDTIVNPIYHWTDGDIWEYVKQERIKMNPLYQKGYHRVGCIGCPLASYKEKMKEFHDYPKYKQAYIHAFDRMIEEREKNDKMTYQGTGWHEWSSGEAVFDWWVEEYKHNVKGQMTIDDFIKEGSDTE